MNLQNISPDEIIYFYVGSFPINATILYTWGVMLLLVTFSYLVTRNLSAGIKISRWQNLLEIVVQFMRDQIRETSNQDPGIYLSFIGTLFIFIAISNMLSVIPGFIPPTSSLSTTTGLAICVFAAVFIYGITQQGLLGYFKQYLKPTPFMLPFNVIGELSRTLALAVRLFGNMLSAAKIAAILLAVIPFIFPIIMQVLGLLTGLIQAYIFAILAMVYIASATRAHHEKAKELENKEQAKKGEVHG